MFEFNCVECGVLVVDCTNEKQRNPPLCATCLFLPGWHEDRELRCTFGVSDIAKEGTMPKPSDAEIQHTLRLTQITADLRRAQRDLEQLILSTPTGRVRNYLTSTNIYLMEALKILRSRRDPEEK